MPTTGMRTAEATCQTACSASGLIAGDVDDDRHVPRCPQRCIDSRHMIDPGILKSDGIQHSRGRLGNAVRGIALAWSQRRALGDDGAEDAAVDLRRIEAVAERPGGNQYGAA